jgi:hypothetical protein
MLHTDHHMILRPYHSHHSLQKQVRRRMISTETMISLQQTAMAVPLYMTLINHIDQGKIATYDFDLLAQSTNYVHG